MRARLLLPFAGALLLGALASGCAATRSGEEAGIAVARIPFACGESAHYELQEIDGTPVASGTFDVLCEGETLLLAQSFQTVGSSGGEAGGSAIADASQVVVDGATMAPLSSSRKATRAGEAERWAAAYTADLSAVEFTHVEPSGDVEERGLQLGANAYENESALWLWRTLALDEGYDEQYVSVSAVSRSQITVRLTVVGRERIEVPAGVFETWRLQVRSGRATRVAWIGIDPPHALVQWDNGEQVFRLLSHEGSRLP